MAFKKCNGILATVLVVLAAVDGAWAATYVVGDGVGWTVPPSPTFYSNWASQHTFVVGDVLVFNFTTGFDSVARVTSTAYAACSSNSPIALATLGPASFTLNSTGPDYFISTFGQQCSRGQRLTVTVTSSSSSSPPPATSPIPVPTPPSGASPPSGSTTPPPAGSITLPPTGATTPPPAGATTPPPAGATTPTPSVLPSPTPSVVPSLPTPSMSPSSSPMGSPGSGPSIAPSGSGMAPGPGPSGGALSPGGGAGAGAGSGAGAGAPGPGGSSGSTEDGPPGSFATKTTVFTPLAVIALLVVGLVM